MILRLEEKDILNILKKEYEKYEEYGNIELFIDYNQKGVEGNNQIIAEVKFFDQKQIKEKQNSKGNFEIFGKAIKEYHEL